MARHINEESLISDVLGEAPGALEVFKRHGIDTDSEGARAIGEVARQLGIDPYGLVWELRKEAEATAHAAAEVDRDF
jgi:iron-sulfur cluster repair protein YtfE (RIC family)